MGADAKIDLEKVHETYILSSYLKLPTSSTERH